MSAPRPKRRRPSPAFHFPAGFVVHRGLQHCPYCQKHFSNGLSLCGHLASCKAGKLVLQSRDLFPLPNDPILVVDEDMFDIFQHDANLDFNYLSDDDDDLCTLTNHYLELQSHCLAKDTVEFRTGHCSLSTNVRKKVAGRTISQYARPLNSVLI
jgi:hypothetical protein